MTSETESYRAGQHNGGSASEAMREASRQARAEVGHEVDKLIDDVENLMRRTRGRRLASVQDGHGARRPKPKRPLRRAIVTCMSSRGKRSALLP